MATQEMFEKMREFCNDRKVVFVTPKAPPQQPRPGWLPKQEYVIVDYLTLLR